MLARMTVRQFYEWMAFYRIEREQMTPPKAQPEAQTPEAILAMLGG